MPRHNELEKTWLPGPSRGTQTFNAPANLVIDYGRHVATVSGRGGSGNNPGASYSILYNTNYNVVYPQANQPETGRPIVNYNTNYNLSYPIANQPEVSRPINGYNVNYNIAYPFTPGPANYNIVYETNYNQVPVADSYGVNYNVAYGINYSDSYNIDGYNVLYNVAGYNVAYGAVYNVAYPAVYNVVNTESGRPVGNSFETGRPESGRPESGRPIANQPASGSYNPATGVNWNSFTYYLLVSSFDGSYFGDGTFTGSGSSPTCPEPTTFYGPPPGTPEVIEYTTVNYTCSPFGNTENYNVNYNIAYNITYNITYDVNYNVTYNVSYPISYNIAYPVNYNVAYPANYNVTYPATFSRTYSVSGYNTVYPFSGYNTNYNIAYPVANQPEVSRPITGYNAAYNIAYPVGNPVAVYSIVYTTNYSVTPVVANYGANYTITYTTNYNVVYPVANTPEASRPIVGYSPGVPGTPTNVLGVYFPGGPVGLPAPTVPETVVQYWEYPDFQTHPVVVPSGGEITIKLE